MPGVAQKYCFIINLSKDITGKKVSGINLMRMKMPLNNTTEYEIFIIPSYTGQYHYTMGKFGFAGEKITLDPKSYKMFQLKFKISKYFNALL